MGRVSVPEAVGKKLHLTAVRSSLRRELGQIGKTQKPPSMACSSRAIPGAGRFPLLTQLPAR